MMADSQQSGSEKCGCGAWKALLVLILFLLGGVIGYLMGSHGGFCRHRWHHLKGYPMEMKGAPSQAPAQ
jgi:hypothetical protein